MSNTDSFIDEVNEEVRRDRLYRMARRYGWIAALFAVAVVGGAAFVEWRKASAAAEAQALGDAIYTALERDDAPARALALEEIPAEGDAAVIVKLLAAGEATRSDAQEAGRLLEEVIATPDVDPVYRDLATLKLTMVPDYQLFSEEKLERLQPLTVPGAPFRLSAMEQIALIHVERNETSEALEMLALIGEDVDASPVQRQRAAQLTIALGGEADAS